MTIPLAVAIFTFAVTLMYRCFFSWKTLSSTRIKNANDAFSTIANYELAKKQLGYASIANFIPNKAEIEFFEKNFQASLDKIKEYSKQRLYIKVRDTDGMLIFEGANQIYWIRFFFKVGMLFGLGFFLYYNFAASLYPAHSQLWINNKVNALCILLLVFFCGFCITSITKTLSFWKNVDITLKDANTAPFTISSILNKIKLR